MGIIIQGFTMFSDLEMVMLLFISEADALKLLVRCAKKHSSNCPSFLCNTLLKLLFA